MNGIEPSSATTDGTVSVLFVDEDFDRCADYVTAVVAEGWRARVIPDADRALTLAESDPPDVVVTEAYPGGSLDGFELAWRVKSGVSTHYLPVILLTDLPLAEVISSARTARCSSVVSRPCDADALIVAVRNALLVANILTDRRAARDVVSREAPRSSRVVPLGHTR
jgi:PleD family two-component response regulator